MLLQCIVDGCKVRFSTRFLLERHINGHFKEAAANRPGGVGGGSGTAAIGTGGAICRDHSDNADGCSCHCRLFSAPPAAAVKQLRRTSKRMKYCKTIYSARILDLFDLGVMAQVRERLALMEWNCTRLSEGLSDRDWIQFRGRVVARRRGLLKAKEKGKKKMARLEPSLMRLQASSKAEEMGRKEEKEDNEMMVLMRWMPEDM